MTLGLQDLVVLYFAGAAILVIFLLFLWQARQYTDWRIFRARGRSPFLTCENCTARYVDSKGGPYSHCPRCTHLNRRY